MKTIASNLVVVSSKIAKNARVIIFVLTLVMFILAAGAPEAIGTVGH